MGFIGAHEMKLKWDDHDPLSGHSRVFWFAVTVYLVGLAAIVFAVS